MVKFRSVAYGVMSVAGLITLSIGVYGVCLVENGFVIDNANLSAIVMALVGINGVLIRRVFENEGRINKEA